MFLSVHFDCVADDHDLELWTWEKLRMDLSHFGIDGGHEFYFENANRFNEDISKMFLNHQMAGIHVDLPWWDGWSVMGSYKHIDNRSKSDENRYILDIYYKSNRIFDSMWDFKFRHRWDIRDRNGLNQITYRLRPSVTLSYPLPLKISNRPIKAYLMNEVNFDTSVNKFNRHRIGTGLSFPFTKNMIWTLGYQLESNKVRPGSWDSDSMIMTGFNFMF